MCSAIKKKIRKNVVKNINIKYSPSVWSYSPMNRLVKKRTVRAEKKNASEYLFVCFPTGVITNRKTMPINPIIRNDGSFLGQKNLSVKWGFPSVGYL